MSVPDPETTQIQAAVYRRLLQHLMSDQAQVQNIDLMILAGFCRNCLSDWYADAAAERGITMTREEAREAVYGMPAGQWKTLHQVEATAAQLAAFEAASRLRTASPPPGV